MSNPFAAPGSDPAPATPKAVAWTVLAAMGGLLLLGPDLPHAWALPAAVYGAMAVGLVALRSRLPARYRTGELREVGPVEGPVEATIPIDLEVRTRPILHVDDRGLRWDDHDLPWDQVEVLAVGRIAGPLLVGGWMVGLAALMVEPNSRVVAIGGVLAAVALAMGEGWRSPGKLTLRGGGAELTLQSRRLDRSVRTRLVVAAQARARGAVVSGPSEENLVSTGLVRPFEALVQALGPSAGIRAAVGGDPNHPDAPVGVLQVRMYGLWYGVLSGVGPMALGIAAGAPLRGAVLVWAIAKGVGAVVVARTFRRLARFAGLALVVARPK